MIDEAVAAEEYDDAKLLLRAYVEHALSLAKPNAIVLSDLGAKAIQTAIATDDDALFELAQKKLRHEDGPRYDFLLGTARWYAAKGDKPSMLNAIMDTLKSFGVGPSEFTKDPSFAAFKKDPDFNLAIKGKYVKAAAAEKSTAKKSAAKKATPTKIAKPKHPKGLVVWHSKPSKKAVHEATRAFFDALTAGNVDAARPMLQHDEGFDENVSALYREMRSIDDELTAKKWNADLSWLENIAIGKMSTDGEPFDADENPSFFVPISYKKESTDVTADFEVRDAGNDYVLACTIIHVM